MDTRKIKKPLTEFIKKIPQSITVEEVIVFGSHSKGEATDESDIDVVVISNDFTHVSPDKRLDILYKASSFIQPDIHPWGFTKEELRKASLLTTLGQVRLTGYRFL